MAVREAARSRVLISIWATLMAAAGPPVGAGTTWYHLSERHGITAVASLDAHELDAHQWGGLPTRDIVTARGGRAVVVYATGHQTQGVFLLTNSEVAPVLSPIWGCTHVAGAVAAGGEIYLATDAGLLRVRGSVAMLQACVPPRDFGHGLTVPGADYLGITVGTPAADGGANVWAITDGLFGHIRFYADPGKWWGAPAGAERPGEPCPATHRWRVPVDVMAGDPARPGLWTYGRHKNGRGDIFYADGYSPGPPYYDGVEFPPPNVAYPRCDRGDMELRRHERSAAPEGVTAPQLQTPLIAADITGRCWLAEGAEGAASIHVFDGQAFTDVTPPPELLKGSQLRQLVCDNSRGELLVATSGAGVLVFDGTHWSEHLLNSVLPTVKDTGMKPVDRIAVAEDSSVWVATASYLLHWTRGEGE